MKVLTSNKQEQALEHFAKMHTASFEEDFSKRYNAILDELKELAIIIGIEDAIPRIADKVCGMMKAEVDSKTHERGKASVRPQGKWIRTGRTNIYGGIEVQCSNCGDKVMVQHLEDEWYCRHCGADMGLKGADDETD